MRIYIIAQIVFAAFACLFLCLTFLTFNLWSLYCALDADERAFCLALYLSCCLLAHCIGGLIKLSLKEGLHL